MSNTYTLAQLRTRCDQRADMEDSDFISDSEQLSYINASYAELYDILVASFQDYYLTSSTFTISSGNTETLPSDFYKLRGLDKQIGADWYALKKFNFFNRNEYNNSLLRRRVSADVRYRIQGSTLYIEPEANANGNYKLWYIPVFTPLSAESDTIDGLNGWEEYIVIDVARKMLAKEESSTAHLDGEKAMMLKRIEDMAAERDSGEPETITNTNTYDWF